MEHTVKKAFLGLAAALAASASFGATVTITSTGPYATPTPFTVCTTVPASLCENFNPTDSVSGTFTTSGPLPANASNLEIGSTVTSYSFSSGLDVIASSNPDARLNSLRITTDASGNITGLTSQVVLWLDGTTPRTNANRFSAVTFSGTSGSGTRNSGCQTLGTGNSGVTDTCLIAVVSDTSRSTGLNAPVSYAAVVAPAAAVSIPTLSQWGTMLMASLLGMFAFLRLRRQR